MTNKAHAELLADVLSRDENSPDPRLREITEAVARHLHAFVEEVGLQRGNEWFAGIQFLTATGHNSDERRQEFILWSARWGCRCWSSWRRRRCRRHDRVDGARAVLRSGPAARVLRESMLVDEEDRRSRGRSATG